MTTSAISLAQAIAARTTTAAAATDAALSAITERDGELHAFLHVDADAARRARLMLALPPVRRSVLSLGCQSPSRTTW